VIGEAGYETLVLPSSSPAYAMLSFERSWCSGGASSAERAWAAGERGGSRFLAGDARQRPSPSGYVDFEQGDIARCAERDEQFRRNGIDG
jgi:hypothetical protein